jgi:hypothetical protein
MAFPDDPLCPAVELFYGGMWNPVVDDVNASDDVVIKRGRSDWSDTADPATCDLIFNNQDGRYSPRNPRSPLYGKIGRNTPLRVRIGESDASLSLPGVNGAYASTPDTAVLDITGDIDIRLDITPHAWVPDTHQVLATKYLSTGDQRSWGARLRDDGLLEFGWGTDGTGATVTWYQSTVAPPVASGRLAVGFTLDVDNGAAQHVVAFYTAPNIGGPWTQLGEVVTVSGTTSIFSGTARVAIGARDGGDAAVFTVDSATFAGRVHALEVRNGIEGAVATGPDFTAQDAGTRSFNDSAGLPWTLHDTAVIEDRSVRSAGEVSAWPPRWDSELDVRVPITASGIRRRLSQGASPLSSALYRGITGGDITSPVAYWPCEDSAGATSFGSALGHDPMKFVGDASKIKPASFDGAASSLPIPVVSTGARFDGTVPEYPASNFARGMTLVNIPDGGVPNAATVIRMRTIGGTTESWFLDVLIDGGLRLRCFAHGGATLVDQTVGFRINGTTGLLWILLEQVGSDIDWQIGHAAIDSPSAVSFSGTLAGQSFGRVHQMIIGQNKDLDGVAVGHVHVLHTEEFWDILRFAKAWNGDSARARVLRLAAEENVPLTADGGDTVTVGPQRPAAFLELVDEAADTDLALLGDRRDSLALHFRSPESLYNQVPALTLDYSSGEVSAPFEPQEDDQNTRNDIVVNRTNGSSARFVQQTGPLSVQAPPLGVGRYDESLTINVEDDAQLPDQAGWRLHLGTVDELRYPSVTVDLAANPHLIDTVTRLDVGDRITIANPPPWLPATVIDLIVLGYTETLNAFKWSITFNCAPGSPWNVWVLEDPDYSRLDTSYSETTATFVSGTDTQLVVASGRFEGFEDNNLLSTTGNTWERTTTQAHTGAWSLYSGVVGAGGFSDAAFTVPEGQQTVQFWYRVSSEASFDFFRFFVDGVEKLSASGEVPWTQSATFDVSDASTITFRYVKDGSVNGGEDAAWVDDLAFQQGVEWETDPALTDVPFDITVSGVQLRVTAITGETSPQTFTVDQKPVNGVAKTIAPGESVELTYPAIVAL